MFSSLNRFRMNLAWAWARQAARTYGGKPSQFFASALKQAHKAVSRGQACARVDVAKGGLGDYDARLWARLGQECDLWSETHRKFARDAQVDHQARVVVAQGRDVMAVAFAGRLNGKTSNYMRPIGRGATVRV